MLCRSNHPGDLSLSQSRAFLREVRGALDRAEAALDSLEVKAE